MSVDIIEFLFSNWQSILITLFFGAFFSYVSYYPIAKIIDSAKKEREKQAKGILLDILESKVINKEEISLETIGNLTDAINREYNVNLSQTTVPKFILQDLNLVFEKSHHLNLSQKDIYCRKIQENIENINKINEGLSEKFEIPKDYSEIIRNLSQEIELEETEKAQKTLTNLENKFRSDKYFEKRGKTDNYEKYQIILSVFAIMTALIGTVQTFFDSSPSNLTTNFSFLHNTYFIIGIFFIITFMVFILVLVLVLKFRNAKDSVLTRLN